MNTITPLFTSYLYKDIDDNFLDSLDAILYLNPPTEHHMKEVINLRFKEGKYGIDVQYNIMDMINIKLIDNFRRIYAFNNKSNLEDKKLKNMYTGKTLHSLLKPQAINNNVNNQNINSNNTNSNASSKLQTNLTSLHEQQNKIYKIIEILGEQLVLANQSVDSQDSSNYYRRSNRKYYKNAVLGKNVEVTAFEMFSYLALHESLQNNNRDVHTNLLQQLSPLNKISWTFASDCLMKIIRKNNTEKAFNTILENLIENNNLNSILNDFELGSLVRNDSWNIGVVDYLLLNHMDSTKSLQDKSNKYHLKSNEQLILIKTIAETKMLDLKQFSQLVSNPEQFKSNLEIILNNESLKQKIEKEFVRAIKPEDILNSETAKLFLTKIGELKTPKILIHTLTNNKLSKEDKQEIAQLYDLSNQELIKDVALAINNRKVDRNVMRDFVNLVAHNVEKTTLAYIISLHPSYMEICKPIYMHIRLTEKTNQLVPIKETQEYNRKLKI